MHLQVAPAGHGINVAGLTHVDFFECCAGLAFGGGKVKASLAVLAMFAFNQVVGKIGQGRQLAVEGAQFVLPIHLELLVMGVQQVNGKGGHVLQIVLAGLRHPQIGLTIGDVADNTGNDNDRNDHQRQDEGKQLPAQFQAVQQGTHGDLDSVYSIQLEIYPNDGCKARTRVAE